MPKCYADLIRSMDPDVDVEAVGDIANSLFRYFGEMTIDDWIKCYRMAKSQSIAEV